MQEQLLNVNAELKDMEEKGVAGGIDMTEGKALRDGFMSNVNKMQICERNLKAKQIKLTDPNCNRTKVLEEKEDATF
jgi:hypothetical protein